MDHIVDYRKDNKAVHKDNQDVTLNGKTYRQKTTRGRQLCIEWKDKSTSWERLSDMKESYPVGSTQVPFLMCTLEIPRKLQHKFLFPLTFCYFAVLLSFSLNCEIILHFVFAPSFIHMDLSIVQTQHP